VRYGEQLEHHRGLRSGHVVIGVAWELGRSKCFLVHKIGQGRRSANEAESWHWERAALTSPVSESKGANKVSGEDSEERTNLRRAFGSLSGSYYRRSEVGSFLTGKVGK
jgi:hypothetical protein